MNRHAYMILVHTNPGQVRKLLSLLDDERNDIYVHIDKSAPFSERDFDGCCSRTAPVFIGRRKISWGGVSIVNAEMDLLKEAVKTSHSYYHLLSGMDLPIKSNDTICRFFEDNAGKEFLDCWKLEEHTLKRVNYWSPFPEGNRFFLTNMLNHAAKSVLKALHIRKNADVTFHQCSQWFSITEDFARYIVDNSAWVEKTFSHTSVCDELLVATLLFRSPYKDNLFCAEESDSHKITLGNLRLIDWSRGGSIRHPWTFTANDLEMLKNAPHLWARKFDERVDSKIIDEVCTLLGQDCGN